MTRWMSTTYVIPRLTLRQREWREEAVLSDLIGIKSQYLIMCKENLHMHECELMGHWQAKVFRPTSLIYIGMLAFQPFNLWNRCPPRSMFHGRPGSREGPLLLEKLSWIVFCESNWATSGTLLVEEKSIGNTFNFIYEDNVPQAHSKRCYWEAA